MDTGDPNPRPSPHPILHSQRPALVTPVMLRISMCGGNRLPIGNTSALLPVIIQKKKLISNKKAFCLDRQTGEHGNTMKV